jgi:HD superfamily phosphohydrolase
MIISPFFYSKKENMIHKKHIIILIFLLLSIKTILVLKKKNNLKYETIETLMGTFTIEKGIISDAIKNKSMQRMNLVDQGGPIVYFERAPHFARYDHCLGVWGLLKRFGAPQNEQLVGLWHDISHTAFSHVADVVFEEKNDAHSYQDKIHLWYLKNSDANNIIDSYNLELDQLDPECGTYNMLEQDLPDMCADRIEYNLHTAYVYNIFTKEEINEILNHLHFDLIEYEDENNIKIEKKWYFDSVIAAKKFALLPLYFMKTVWNAPYSLVTYKIFSDLIRYAFKKNYLTSELFHFGTDKDILAILEKSEDEKIQESLNKLHNIEDHFSLLDSTSKDYDEIIRPKFRGIDPLVKEKKDNTAKRLTKIDKNFAYIYHTTKKETAIPIKIKYT